VYLWVLFVILNIMFVQVLFCGKALFAFRTVEGFISGMSAEMSR